VVDMSDNRNISDVIFSHIFPSHWLEIKSRARNALFRTL